MKTGVDKNIYNRVVCPPDNFVGMRKILGQVFLAVFLLLSPISVFAKNFPDVPISHQNYDSIRELSDALVCDSGHIISRQRL